MDAKIEQFNEKMEKVSRELQDTYCYIKDIASYYWLDKRKFFKHQDVMNNLMCSNKEIQWLRSNGTIKTYDGICYKK